MPGRGMGERLAVDPNNPKILYFGARSGNGLWKSTDGGSSFSKVTSFTNVGDFIVDPNDSNGYNSDKTGLTFVTFDSTSSTVGGATSRIFVGTADKDSSVYVSNDAGKTWEAVAGQPKGFFPHKARLQPEEKALYFSYSDGVGPYDGTSGAVYRYDITAKAWKDITPPGDIYHGFGGLSVDLQEPGTVMVAALNSWYPDVQFFRSTDSGKTWSTFWRWGADGNLEYSYEISSPKAPWIYKNFISVDTKRLGWMVEALVIDPFDSNHWLYGTGLTLYGGRDLTKLDSGGKVKVESLADGIEEFAVLDVRSAAGGSELLAGVGDDSGFTFPTKASLSKPPASAWDNPMFTSAVSVDYAGNKPSQVVRIGNVQGKPQAAVSSDGGVTWNAHPGASNTASDGTVAISADGKTIVWSTGNEGVLRAQNSNTFASVSGLPSGSLVASDKRKNGVFYGASGSSFYISTSAGSSFKKAGIVGSAGSIRDIVPHPTKEGDVWVSTDDGVYHSTNSGTSFTKASTGLTNTYQIGLGKGTSASWNIYAFGHGSAGAKLYGSSDLGKTWVDIQGSQGFGVIDGAKLDGSGNVAGQVYVGTNGRGVFWAQGSL